MMSPLGIGREEVWDALAAGQNGVRDVELFEAPPSGCRLAAPVVDFDAAALLGRKGLRSLDRSARFVIGAAKMALEDGGLDLEASDDGKRGLVLGTAFGNLTSQREFNGERVLEGPAWVSPGKFPNVPINSPSYQIPIRYRMRMVNVTVSSGITSGLDAMRYAVLTLQRRPEAMLLCGGVDELSFLAYHSAHRLQELAGLAGEAVSAPFSRQRNGYILGEGCVMLVLESQQALAQRGGKAVAEILGYGSSFAPAHGRLSTRVDALAAAMTSALQSAGLTPADIDCLTASAHSGKVLDLIEARAIAQVFGQRLSDLAITAVKSMMGESFGASGPMQCVAAMLAIQRGIIPPTINLQDPDPACGLECVTETGYHRDVRYALVNSLDRFGAAISVVLGRADENGLRRSI